MHKKRVVILVDSKKRDLMGAALIAHHLEQNGIQAYLEPLQSWQSCLLDLKPDVILFNHLLHSHLCKYTENLKKLEQDYWTKKQNLYNMYDVY